jgi:hypothetical protein
MTKKIANKPVYQQALWMENIDLSAMPDLEGLSLADAKREAFDSSACS